MIVIQLLCEPFSHPKLVLAISTTLAISPYALLAAPIDGVVTSGNAQIVQSGTATNITQHTSEAVINWQGFSVGSGESVNFYQPDSSSITLNRVLGNERSVIDGALNANGQIFLINSNGILFTKGSSVNAAGLVASTMDISNKDFETGHYVFQESSGSGSVINMGTISAANGGYVALLGKEALNQGVIVATRGTVALSAGEQITLNFNGDSLLNVSIDQGVLNALVENRQAIYADGGKVFLTARAADELLTSQVNNTGLIEAHTLGDLKGEIVAHAYGGSAHISGTLDASAPNGGDGGFIETSGDKVEIASSARITTQAAAGKTGHWFIDPDGFTIAKAGGDITGAAISNALNLNNINFASTQGGGNNGDINVNDLVNWSANTTLGLTATHSININAPITGANGGLTLSAGADVNFNAQSSANVATLTATAAGNVNFNAPQFWTTPGTRTFAGNNINVNDAVSWSDGVLSLNAAKFINLNAVMTASDNARLVATYNTGIDTSTDANGVPTPTYGTPLGGINPLFDSTRQEFVGRIDFTNNTATNPLTINDHQYTLITSIGASGAHDMSIIDANGGIGFYALSTDLTAPSTAFSQVPVLQLGGVDAALNYVPSALEGLGHAIRDLTINQQQQQYGTGLFGMIVAGSSVSNINLVNINVTGAYDKVGSLVGYNYGGSISNAYASGAVNATAVTDSFGSLHNVNYVGGLVGYNLGIIYRSGANVDVTTKDVWYVGGFAGINDSYGTAPLDGVIIGSYAKGAVNLKFTNYNAAVNPVDDTGFGGFVGTNHFHISSSSSSGPVNVVAQTPLGFPISLANIGGFAGVNSGFTSGTTALISDSSSSSSVNAQVVGGPDQGGFGNVGGFVGRNDDGVNNSSAFGHTYADNSYNVGGFAGGNFGVLTGNTFNSATTGQNSGVGGSGDVPPSNVGATNTTATQPSTTQGWQPSSQAKYATDARAQAQALANQSITQRGDVAALDQSATQATVASTASQLGSARMAEVQRYADSSALASPLPDSAPPSIDNNIVSIEPSSYSAHVQSIEVDGVIYDLDEEDKKQGKN
ncbi:filamentous hemagglutinin N-terminal domain-containing protein [Methylomonas sp. AM2-LC]|uniref:two-partner secretion domain-containing protein n=1 Tax=Methylomonas sp. AM2-LC TaxID=3153301 RepID=UPI003266311F